MRILLFFLLAIGSALGADVLTNYHAINWNAVGSDVPFRTTVHNSVAYTTSDSQSTIQTALSACASNSLVWLAAGTYTWSSKIDMKTLKGVTFRGTTNSYGYPTTILRISANNYGCIELGGSFPPSSPSTVSVSSGYTKGSTSIVVGSTPTGLAAQQLFFIDQANTARIDGGTEGSSWGRDNTGSRLKFEMKRCTSVSGTTVNFEPAIYDDFSGAASPEIEYWATPLGGIRNSVEDMVIDYTGSYSSSDHNIFIMGDSHLIRNCVLTNQAEAGIRLGYSLGTTIKDCIFQHHLSYASASYSVWAHNSSGARIENNYFTDTPSAIGILGCSGSFIGYNYTTNYDYTANGNHLPQIFFNHGAHNVMILWEGNWCGKFAPDHTHGTSAYNTIINNRILGYDVSTDNDQVIPVHFADGGDFIDYFTFCGNVMGWDGFHDAYEGGEKCIWRIDSGDCRGTLRIGNYNTFDDAIRSAEAFGSTTVSNSYAYFGSSRPEHWGSRWPAFTSTDYSGSNQATNIPAGYRWFDANHAWPVAGAAGGGGVAGGSGGPGRGKARAVGAGVRALGP